MKICAIFLPKILEFINDFGIWIKTTMDNMQEIADAVQKGL